MTLRSGGLPGASTSSEPGLVRRLRRALPPHHQPFTVCSLGSRSGRTHSLPRMTAPFSRLPHPRNYPTDGNLARKAAEAAQKAAAGGVARSSTYRVQNHRLKPIHTKEVSTGTTGPIATSPAAAAAADAPHGTAAGALGMLAAYGDGSGSSSEEETGACMAGAWPVHAHAEQVAGFGSWLQGSAASGAIPPPTTKHATPCVNRAFG